MAYKACENASYDTFLQGNYGAGMGATVGKYMGRERSMKSGIGAYAVQLGELKVGAVVTLNALGDIYDIDTDKKIAGALDENGLLFDDETAYFEAAAKIQNMFTGNTTIGTIITNAKLDKTALARWHPWLTMAMAEQSDLCTRWQTEIQSMLYQWAVCLPISIWWGQ